MKKPRKIDMSEVVFSVPPEMDPGFIEPTPEEIAELEAEMRRQFENDPFVQRVKMLQESLPEEDMTGRGKFGVGSHEGYDINEVLGIQLPPEHARTAAAMPPQTGFPWRFGEDRHLSELTRYIENTYGSHYAASGVEGIQAFDAILAAGAGIGFCVGDIIKYAMRLGKKDGWNRKDVLKIAHYSLLLLYAMEYEGELMERGLR